MRTNINIPDALIAKANKRAEELGVPRSAYICMAIAKQLETDEVWKQTPQMVSDFLEAMKITQEIPGMRKIKK